MKILSEKQKLQLEKIHNKRIKLVEGVKSGDHPLYRTWRGMKDRCYNPNRKEYRYYGGRGIVVCDRWKDSFKFFVEAMGAKPSKEYSIDRIDNNGNYEPINCKWSTVKEQNNNRDISRGEDHYNSKLSDKEILEIKSLRVSKIYKQCELADLYNVSTAHISLIINNKRRITLDN